MSTPSPRHPPTAADFRRRAKRALPRFLFDYIEGGAGAERCRDAGRADLDAVLLVPRPLDTRGPPDGGIVIAGRRIAAPLLIAPMGLADLVRPGADVAMAAAAARADVPFVQSGASLTRYADLPRRPGAPPWYQIYVHDDDDASATMTDLAARGGEDLVVTVDMAIGGIRHRDLANRFGPHVSARMVLQSFRRPLWQARYLRARLAPAVRQYPLPAAIAQRRFERPLDWDRLARLRQAWRGRLWIKGLLHPGDAVRAVAAGVDGVIISNHGGRQLDLAPSAWRMLPAIRAALGADVPILADGGVCSGEDVARAVALGADAAFVGRPMLHAVAAAGTAGADEMLARLRYEFDVCLRLLGCSGVADLRGLRLVDGGADPPFSGRAGP